MTLVFTLCHVMSLNTRAGYRRVVQGLGSPKRRMVPRREKAEARCSRYQPHYFVSLLIYVEFTIYIDNLCCFQFQFHFLFPCLIPSQENS
jgi:hypothetical protein